MHYNLQLYLCHQQLLVSTNFFPLLPNPCLTPLLLLRPTVKEMLNNYFIQEDIGVVEVVNKDEAVASNDPKITLRWGNNDSHGWLHVTLSSCTAVLC
jgi:hypothetical protein